MWLKKFLLSERSGYHGSIYCFKAYYLPGMIIRLINRIAYI